MEDTMSTEALKDRNLLPGLADLLSELNTFLKKLGIGKTTISNYASCLKAMTGILRDKRLGFKDIENPIFKDAYFRVNKNTRKLRFNTIKRFLWYKGLFDSSSGVSEEKTLLEDARQHYLKTLVHKGFKAKTITGAECDTRKFIEFCLEEQVVSIDGLSKRIVDRFVTRLFVVETNTYCLNKKIKILYDLKSFLRFLFESGRTLVNLSTYIEVPRREKKVSRNFFKTKEILKLFAVIDTNTLLGFMDRTMYEILYGTGIRIGELCSLRTGEVDLAAGTLFIKDGKGGMDRVVPLITTAKNYLQVYLENVRSRIINMAGCVYGVSKETDSLFITAQGKRIIEGNITGTIARYLADAGITGKKSAHGFRYSCATHMLENGAEIRYISDLLGHRRLDTTGSYTRVNPKNLLDTIKLHPRAKGLSIRFKDPKKRHY